MPSTTINPPAPIGTAPPPIPTPDPTALTPPKPPVVEPPPAAHPLDFTPREGNVDDWDRHAAIDQATSNTRILPTAQRLHDLNRGTPAAVNTLNTLVNLAGFGPRPVSFDNLSRSRRIMTINPGEGHMPRGWPGGDPLQPTPQQMGGSFWSRLPMAAQQFGMQVPPNMAASLSQL